MSRPTGDELNPARRNDAGNAGSRSDEMALGSGIARRAPGPERGGLYVSFGVHIALAAVLVFTGVLHASKAPEFVSYKVKLYSPPPQVEGPKPETPAPAPVSKIVAPPKTVKPIAKPLPKSSAPEVKRIAQTPVVDTTRKQPAQQTVGAHADPNSPGGEGIDVNQEGVECPDPQYCANIIMQINRYFRFSGGGQPTALVVFYISRDGTVGGIQLLEKSGDLKFNLEAISAVEQAGKRGAFGRLPDVWVQDRLWVRYRFVPPGT